jgi:hypothetical protein
MVEIRFRRETPVPPDVVLTAAIDFSENRPQIWTMLSPEIYRVHEVGATSADVTEGSAVMGGIWAREEYDWSVAGTVRAVVRESNVFAPGSSWELTVEALPGGSAVSWLARRRGVGFKGRLLTAVLRLRGEKMLSGYLAETLARLEVSSPSRISDT